MYLLELRFLTAKIVKKNKKYEGFSFYRKRDPLNSYDSMFISLPEHLKNLSLYYWKIQVKVYVK